MISNYLKSKNIIQYIKPHIDYDELLKNNSNGFFYLNTYPHSNLIYYYEDLFTSNELEWITMIGNKLPKENATIGSDTEVDTTIRKSIVSWIGVNNVTQWIYDKLSDGIKHVNDTHYKYDLEKLENLQFTHYSGESSGFYRCHLDSNNENLPTNRKLSFVLQLSDPSEYEGGELKLHLGGSPLIVKKQKGLITFFPSNMLHECTPLTKGERYVIVGWVHGPAFK
jgi:PKHD-type hydroxylase